MSEWKSNIPADLDLNKKFSPARTEYQKKLTKEKNKEIYGHIKWVVRSPGNDLLDFYDLQNELLGKDNRAFSAIPPSVVYHYRFEHQYPKELFDKSKNYGRLAYLRDKLNHYHQTTDPKDKTYWGQVYSKRYDWLVNRPHTSYEFDTKADALTFLKEKTGQKSIRDTISVHTVTNRLIEENIEHLYLRGEARGWSIITEKKNCKHLKFTHNNKL